MFKRPTDPKEYNELYAIPAFAALGTYMTAHFMGGWEGCNFRFCRAGHFHDRTFHGWVGRGASARAKGTRGA